MKLCVLGFMLCVCVCGKKIGECAILSERFKQEELRSLVLPSPAKAGRQAEMREREETSGSGAGVVDDNHGCPAHVGFLALEIAPALSPSDPRDLSRLTQSDRAWARPRGETENRLQGSRRGLELGSSQPAKPVVEAPAQLRAVSMGSGARRLGSGQAWISPGGAAGNQGAISDREEGQCDQSAALLSRSVDVAAVAVGAPPAERLDVGGGGAVCHGPECTGSKKAVGSYGRSIDARDLAGTGSRHGRSAVSMETMETEDQAHMQGGPSTATMRTKCHRPKYTGVMGLNAQVARRLLRRHGRSATSMESAASMETMDMEDRAVCMVIQAPPQGGPSSRSIQMVPTQGLEKQESKELSPVKGKEQCIGNRQVGPEEEEQCRRSRHSSGGTGVPSKQGSKEEEQCRRSRHSSGGQEWC
ncbi:uncharacterized protein UHOD_11673 [Ustilago sp. UG-2017b]|nr:uncharacterized protein UHOD_11673 [Ustilago sp. UG-2017b]